MPDRGRRRGRIPQADCALSSGTSLGIRPRRRPRSGTRDLVERGYYQGSNVSYNIKKLVDMGYLEQERSTHDRRSVRVRLTEKAMGVVHSVRELEENNALSLARQEVSGDDIEAVCGTLRRVERTWTDYIHYGKR